MRRWLPPLVAASIRSSRTVQREHEGIGSSEIPVLVRGCESPAGVAFLQPYGVENGTEPGLRQRAETGGEGETGFAVGEHVGLDKNVQQV